MFIKLLSYLYLFYIFLGVEGEEFRVFWGEFLPDSSDPSWGGENSGNIAPEGCQ